MTDPTPDAVTVTDDASDTTTESRPASGPPAEGFRPTAEDVKEAREGLQEALRAAGLIGPNDVIGGMGVTMMPTLANGLPMQLVMQEMLRGLARQLHDYAEDFELVGVTNPPIKCKLCDESIVYELDEAECRVFAEATGISFEEAWADRALEVDDVGGVLTMIMAHDCPTSEAADLAASPTVTGDAAAA